MDIREMRGIRTLEISPGRKSFVISGPNGSGKSGVVDAIQFGLTGDISRLSGKGTGGLTVQRHGPHVEKRDDPEAAEVSLRVFVPETSKTVVLKRSVKTAKTFTLTPEDAKVRAVLEDVAQHPELTLSRREIIKYILVEAGERSKEIQALLKLDDVGNIRSALQTARNKLSSAHTTAQKDLGNAENALRRHLDIKNLSDKDILAAVNPQRRVLGLAQIREFTTDTILNAGVLEGGAQPAFHKQSALRDVGALRVAQVGFGGLGKREVAALLTDIATLESDPELLQAITRRAFVERGLSLVDGPLCPLCDTEWDDVQHLKGHLQAKLAKFKEAEALQQRLLKNAADIAHHARQLVALIAAVQALAKAEGPPDFAADLATWSERLSSLAMSLGTIEEVIAHKADFEADWIRPPAALGEKVSAFAEGVKARPDQSASVAAQTFLMLAQDRLNLLCAAQRAERHASDASTRGQVVYKAYCDAMEEQLGALYAAVEGDFSTYYRAINSDDEGAFKAKLEPSEGKLDLEVAFYDKGMFPPAAYHSEGHQDGMGVCLYLALMKRVLGKHFSFAVLDDVVMSVDQGHRKQFCALLKTRFPDTQFIITTHDKVWAKQMQTEGLVDSKGGIVFHSWTVQTGPIFEELADVWGQIDKDLAKHDISAAAARLRRHLEYISAELADNLGAKPVYRGDFSYDLGDLLPFVIGRQAELLKLAAKSAQDWKNDDAKAKVDALKTTRAEVMRKYGGESWVVNRAVHYTEWADFSKAEFRAVVEAFKTLLLQFRCPNAGCDSWLYVTPRKGDPEALRCRCAALNLNLTGK
ncbi:MAG TPA: AAA family ATPase [Vicinamibacterales bacterium]|nr:AAA family ATPase [Vicinamibacterales bacterium]